MSGIIIFFFVSLINCWALANVPSLSSTSFFSCVFHCVCEDIGRMDYTDVFIHMHTRFDASSDERPSCFSVLHLNVIASSAVAEIGGKSIIAQRKIDNELMSFDKTHKCVQCSCIQLFVHLIFPAIISITQHAL